MAISIVASPLGPLTKIEAKRTIPNFLSRVARRRKTKGLRHGGSKTMKSPFPKVTNRESLKTTYPRAPFRLQEKSGSNFSLGTLHPRPPRQHHISILSSKEWFEIVPSPVRRIPKHIRTAWRRTANPSPAANTGGAARPEQRLQLFAGFLQALRPETSRSASGKRSLALADVRSRRSRTAKGTTRA